MGIPVGFDFKRTSPKPIDSSMVLTKAEMIAIDDNIMPDNYFAVCKDDSQFYIYDKAVEPTPETGKFILLGGDGVGTLDEVLTKGNTTSKDINISGEIGSETARNRIHSQGYTVSKADNTSTSGGGGSRTTSIGSGAMTLYGTYVKNGSIVDERDFSFGYSVNRSEEKITARVQMDDEMKQAWRDALNIADKNYTTTEKKVGTFLGKDLYEITLTGISINTAPSSGQVTWYDLTANKGIQRGWDIVDYEVLSRIADNTSSATRSVLDGLILRGGGIDNWTIGNKYQSNMYIRALTLRYVKEAV